MSNKPIFVATHPRACSTAFERVFMTRRDALQCVHEPFGDAYYFGPERLAQRYEHDAQARADSGFDHSTYKTIMDRINRENSEGKRLLIKDMAQYFLPPDGKPVSIAPSLLHPKRGVGTTDKSTANGSAGGSTNGIHAELVVQHGHSGAHFDSSASVSDQESIFVKGAPYQTPTERDNPTVVPTALLGQFHFAFLIRHPNRSIPSYYRCCIPPLDEMTGFHNFRPDEAGYVELVRLFDYLRSTGVVGPQRAKSALSNGHGANGHANGDVNGYTNGHTSGAAPETKQTGVEICVIDADDLLDKPQEVIGAFCRSVGIDFNPDMLNWDSDEQHELACDAFEKWKGFHEDAINSKDLKPRTSHLRVKSRVDHYDDWVAKYGQEGADIIQKSVDENVKHYEYLKQFCVEV